MNLSVITEGVENILDDGVLAWLEAYDNLGMAELERLSESGPLQHGDTDRGYRLRPRFPAFVFGVVGDDPNDLADNRDALLAIFKPRSGTIQVKVTRENGDVRCLDCHYSGGMNMPSDDKHGLVYQKVSVVLKASEPAFYDPVGEAVTFSLGGGAGGGAIPMPVPTEVGASTIDQSLALTYDGTWLTYPQIRITGPITDCIITNSATGEKLDFTGVTIAAGHYYDLDLRYGYKTVLLDGITNKVSDLTTDSDLATWHIDHEAPGGINSIRVTGSNITGATQVQISYFNRYNGV